MRTAANCTPYDIMQVVAACSSTPHGSFLKLLLVWTPMLSLEATRLFPLGFPCKFSQ
ncbi:hypothetical protein B0H19DRAFT_1118126 [Mycena capillaripes]|nr:hypothetical protein B0H19DRAFT_1118126 [Mycena capillaripes]